MRAQMAPPPGFDTALNQARDEGYARAARTVRRAGRRKGRRAARDGPRYASSMSTRLINDVARSPLKLSDASTGSPGRAVPKGYGNDQK